MKKSVNPSESASNKRAAVSGNGRVAAGRPAALLLAVGLAMTTVWGGMAAAQQQPIDQLALPVAAPPEPMGFIADSPVAAADTLRRIGEHIRGNNIEPAAALLRQLLAEQPHALVPVQSDPDLHEPVRSHARRLILTRPFSSTPRHLAVMIWPFLTSNIK